MRLLVAETVFLGAAHADGLDEFAGRAVPCSGTEGVVRADDEGTAPRDHLHPDHPDAHRARGAS